MSPDDNRLNPRHWQFDRKLYRQHRYDQIIAHIDRYLLAIVVFLAIFSAALIMMPTI